MDKFWFYNVVMYDGGEAFVYKFILLTDGTGEAPTKEARLSLDAYIYGNGEILKIEPLYPVSLDNVIAMGTSVDDETKCAYDRFKTMYFDC